MLIKNMYTLCGLKCVFGGVINGMTNTLIFFHHRNWGIKFHGGGYNNISVSNFVPLTNDQKLNNQIQ